MHVRACVCVCVCVRAQGSGPLERSPLSGVGGDRGGAAQSDDEES